MRSLLATPEARVTALLVSIGVAIAGGWVRLLSVPLVDDASISIAFGWTAWTGGGLRLTPESAVVEGFSNPLWTAIVGLTPLVSDDPIELTKAIGIGLALASLPIWALWMPLAQSRALRLEDALVPALAGSSTSFAYWAAAGLEGGLLTFLLALSGALLLRDLRRGRGTLAGLALGLVCITRPEAGMYAVIALVLVLGVRASQRRAPGRQELGALAWGILVVGGYLALRVATFAAIMPNTYYAKFGVSEPSWGYARAFLDAFPTFSAAALAGATTVLLARPAARRALLLAIGFCAATLVFTMRAGGDWMREWRFLAPLVPAAAVVLAGGLSTLRDVLGVPGPTRAARARVGRALAVVLGVVVLRHAWIESGWRVYACRTAATLPTWIVARYTRDLEALLHDELGLVRPRVAVPDVGGNGLYLRRAEIVDVGALCDYAIARTFHANPRATEDYLLHEGLPTLIDVHGPSGAIGRMYELREHYERLPVSHRATERTEALLVLRGITRDQDPRCPGGLAAVLALSPAELEARIEGAIAADDADHAIRLHRCAREHREDAPDPAWLARASALALAESERHEVAGELEPALRFSSLATILAREDAWLRRRTELLRERLIPPPPEAQRRRW